MLGELADEGQKEAITAGGPITMVANVFDPYGKLRDRERDTHVSRIPPLKICRPIRWRTLLGIVRTRAEKCIPFDKSTQISMACTICTETHMK